MRKNILLNTDSYKASHYLQYPPGAEYVSSYIEARGGEYDEIVFFGLQAFIKEYLSKPFTQEDLEEAAQILPEHGLPFNYADWAIILEEYNGYLPITIEAVPEGTVLPVSNVLVQVCNTDKRFPWLTSYVETMLLRAIWYPTTVATHSRDIKKVIKKYLDLTCDNPSDELPFKLHDFGARGVSSEESSMLGGMAHLVNFQGTDNLSAVRGAREYYNEPMAGFSIPASEHSTMTSWGKDNEVQAYENMLEKFSSSPLVACVSDSYDIYNAVENIWGSELKERVETFGGTLICRPDSGSPVWVPIECIERLMDKFGFTVNAKGFKVLPNCVRVLQGDGIGKEEIKEILHNLQSLDISAENIAFGCGGGLLQKVNRDTCKFAMKASAICVNGEWRDVYKDPVTDKGKVSKKGILDLVKTSKGFKTIRKEDFLASDAGYSDLVMNIIFRDGLWQKSVTSFSEIRARASL